MIKVLFVDDEPRVLDGLRRAVRSMRSQWDTRFSASAIDALALLREWQADVIVTDMQMPGMSGVQLMDNVKRLYPATIRFVLSGHASLSAMLQAATAAHQYLAKPCDTQVLKSAIDRARSLRTTLSDSKIALWTGTAEALPSLPEAFQRISTCLQEQSASIAEVAAVIMQDPAVSTMLLKLANSAFFGSGHTIRTAERAVSYLGIEMVGALVLASGVFKASQLANSRLDVGALWQHSLQTAAIARELAVLEKWTSARADDAFMAGLLHDLGHLVMASAPAPQPGSAEIDHGQVGAYVVGLWGFPDELVEAIAFHHLPSRASAAGVSLCAIVHAAHLLAFAREGGSDAVPSLHMDLDFFNRDGMADRWKLWQAHIGRAASAEGAAA